NIFCSFIVLKWSVMTILICFLAACSFNCSILSLTIGCSSVGAFAFEPSLIIAGEGAFGVWISAYTLKMMIKTKMRHNQPSKSFFSFFMLASLQSFIDKSLFLRCRLQSIYKGIKI